MSISSVSGALRVAIHARRHKGHQEVFQGARERAHAAIAGWRAVFRDAAAVRSAAEEVQAVDIFVERGRRRSRMSAQGDVAFAVRAIRHRSDRKTAAPHHCRIM